MSETYPRKTHCETLFAGHISLQRRIRLQRYKKNAYAQVLCNFFCLEERNARREVGCFAVGGGAG